MFALRLTQIRKHQEGNFDRIFGLLLRTPSLLGSRLLTALLDGRLTKSQLTLVEDLDSLPEFAGLVASMESDEQRWLAFLDHPTAERELPQPWLQNG